MAVKKNILTQEGHARGWKVDTTNKGKKGDLWNQEHTSGDRRRSAAITGVATRIAEEKTRGKRAKWSSEATMKERGRPEKRKEEKRQTRKGRKRGSSLSAGGGIPCNQKTSILGLTQSGKEIQKDREEGNYRDSRSTGEARSKNE